MSRSYKKHYTVSDNRTSNAKHGVNKYFNENRYRRNERKKGKKPETGHYVCWDIPCDAESIYQEVLRDKDKVTDNGPNEWVCYQCWLNGRRHNEGLLRKYCEIEAHKRSAK